MKSNLGKVLHLNDDGTPASNNPFAQQSRVTAEIWSFGHRNPLGIAFDAKNQLWVVEMGPKGGDELNLIREGKTMVIPSFPMETIMMVKRFLTIQPDLNFKTRAKLDTCHFSLESADLSRPAISQVAGEGTDWRAVFRGFDYRRSGAKPGERNSAY